MRRLFVVLIITVYITSEALTNDYPKPKTREPEKEDDFG